MTRASTQNDYAARILRVLSFLQTHLDEAITPGDLAKIACFSPHHFHRVFKGMVGESAMGHIRRLRLERAASRLKRSEQSVTRIAFDAGYENHESFTRAFGAMFGAAPTEFRASARFSEQAASSSASAAVVHYHLGGDVQGFAPLTETRSQMRIEIVKLPARRVAYIRHVGPYNQCGTAFAELSSWAAEHGLLGPDAHFIGRSYDDPEITPPEKVRYDACIAVGDDVQASGRIGIADIPGGEYAVARHVGPYERLSETYEALLGRWLAGQGREAVDAPSMERYWNDPEGTEPEDLETDVCVLLV